MLNDDQVKPKTKEEMRKRLEELLHRNRKRFIKNNTKPKGSNCAFVVYDSEADQYRCTRCGTTDPDRCLNHDLFEPKKSREELIKQFSENIKNPQIMLRDYRDIATILWCLGYFDE